MLQQPLIGWPRNSPPTLPTPAGPPHRNGRLLPSALDALAATQPDAA
jgi:hypothetical protein